MLLQEEHNEHGSVKLIHECGLENYILYQWLPMVGRGKAWRVKIKVIDKGFA